MKIAVLGFGSLINNLESRHYGGKLEVEKYAAEPLPSIAGLNIGPESPFLPALGLKLPAALGRLSCANTQNRRITMVLSESMPDVPVYFAVSKKETLEEAICNLAEREGINPMSSAIGFVNVLDGEHSSRLTSIVDRIKNWAQDKFDAVIWTDLGETLNPSPEHVLQLLKKDSILCANTQAYVRDLPGPLTDLQKGILALPVR